MSERKSNGTLRQMKIVDSGSIDFASNDFLGYAVSGILRARMEELKTDKDFSHVGATGSRLITGNSKFLQDTEKEFASLLGSETALFFNSGYLANLGILSALGDRGSLFLYDENIHASIKEGIRAGFSSKYSFKHNDSNDLEKLLASNYDRFSRIYVVTEGVFSMDGDVPDLEIILSLCRHYDAALILDEAHALGTYGKASLGAGYDFRTHPNLFVRIYPLGKAAGTHGAFFCGSEDLADFFTNFSRSFIYTTAPAFDQILSVSAAVSLLRSGTNFKSLQNRITDYLDRCNGNMLSHFSKNKTAIQFYRNSDYSLLTHLVKQLRGQGISVFPIWMPTVRKGEERLRIILHSFNTKEEINLLIQTLSG